MANSQNFFCYTLSPQYLIVVVQFMFNLCLNFQFFAIKSVVKKCNQKSTLAYFNKTWAIQKKTTRIWSSENSFINQYYQVSHYQICEMQAEIDPTLEIIPFDDKLAVRADINIAKQSQKLFVMKTFMMFVLEIRSAMDQTAIRTLKTFILETCEQLLERGGIDNVGFVINKNYYTIRNPNYEGIKDLLAANVKVEDSTDIRETIICLRNSIHLQAKKMQSSKISILMFTSNVAESTLNPVKKSYRVRMNQHIVNYEKEIARLGNTIREMCDDCYFYSIGYIKKYDNDKEKEMSVFWQDNSIQAIDAMLLYNISSICKRKQFSYNICQSYSDMCQKFNEVSALILYQFHQFSLMVPVRNTEKQTYTPMDEEPKPIPAQKKKQVQQMKMDEIDIDIDDEQLQKYLQEHKGQMEEVFSQEEEQNLQIEYEAMNEKDRDTKYVKLDLTNIDETKFTTANYTYFNKWEVDLKELSERGYHIFRKVDKKKEQLAFPQKNKVIKKLAYLYTPEYISTNVNYHEPTSIELITCQSQYYKTELSDIIFKMREKILKYKKRFIGTYKKVRLFQTYIEVDEVLQSELRNRLYKIDQIVKQMYEKVFKDPLIKNEKAKRRMFELYSSIKSMIDTTNEVFMNIYKKQIKNEDIGKLSAAINYDKIKSSLKRKLIKRVNSNPKLIDDVYDRVEQICSKQLGSFVDLQAKYKTQKQEVGNCMYTFKNFATSLRDRDCLALIFEIQRPPSAIADPGRIRIRQVSTLVTGVSKFFQTHQYFIRSEYESIVENAIAKASLKYDDEFFYSLNHGCPCCNDSYCQYDFDGYLREYALNNKDIPFEKYKDLQEKRKGINFGINKSDYKQNWDYWNRVESKTTFFGIMPLYICEENWKVAKQLMKPCMGWTACGEPLGYSYSQTQTIPFMVLSNLIRLVQESTYRIEQLTAQSRECATQKDRCELLHQANMIKHKRRRHQDLLKQAQQTCKAIMRDMSGPNNEQPLDKSVVEKYINYERPICRTLDVISNNSCFIAQIYTAIKLGAMEKPDENKFHEFFKRFVEEELRRQTDGWNQQEAEEHFVNKLLNVQVQKMEKPQYMVLESEYADRFNQALLGAQVLRTEFQIQREALEMVIKQDNKFNQTQRLAIIEYKRLYQNRVLWVWYVRFLLYGQKERITIHKWKCLDLTNSYQLFTMIIQNKKQRKNWKRREAILQGSYVDPFDYYQARPYLEQEFVMMRNKKEAKNIVLLNAQKYGRASQVFAMSRDIREAAGAIMNAEVGREIPLYYVELCRGCNDLAEKLRILLTGEYQGVQLFKHGWKMSKKRMGLLRRHYPYEFMRYQYMF